MIPKGAGLPLAFGGLGVGYLVVTYLARPPERDTTAHLSWERHVRDAKVAAAFGVAAGAILWFTRGSAPQPRHSWY
jgi:hypothetical protein